MSDPGALRILFAGTPEFAVTPLEQLLTEGFRPVAVLTQPDRPAGRGRQPQPSPVKRVASAAGIPVHQPDSLRSPEARELIRSLAPDLLVVVAYGLLLPADILAIPRHGCWNIHASLLPRWRGAAPIQRAVEAGDRESGVSIMQMDAGLDTGPVLHVERIPLQADETAGSLHDRLRLLGARALLHCLHRLAAGRPPRAVPQSERGVSYARKLQKEEAQVDWREPAELIERRIRAFNPWPVAWCSFEDQRMRLWRAVRIEQITGRPPGTIVAAGRDGIDVATGRGVLRLLELQPAGRRRMSAADYLNAYHLPERLDGQP